MISYAQLLLILSPICLAMFFYILRIERALVRISTELKGVKEVLAA